MEILRLSSAGLLLAAGFLATRPSLAQAPPKVTASRVSPVLLDDWARHSASGTFREFVELLAIPNDQQVPEDIQKNAAWLEAAFARRGFGARQFANEGRPMVFAEYPGAKPARKTVLFYLHLDGQPVTPSEWKQESPWKATLKRRTSQGVWETLPPELLFGKDIDPEWRIFARSSSDDKGPILMFLAAVDAIRAQGLATGVNVKVILDSQEEKYSPSMPRVVAENREALRADAVVIIDGPKHETNQSTLMFGNRGLLAATLRVFGSRNELHSGHYGNYAPNPAQRLATLLASMKDDGGRVTIPGFYDGVVLDDATRKLLAQVPDDEAALQKRLGIAAPDKVGGSYQEALQYPSLNVRGIAASDVGTKVRGVVPEFAVAEIDIRTVPETPPERLQTLLERHIQAQGYYLVKGSPTEEERATHPKLAALVFGDASAQGSAARTDVQAPVAQWLTSALRKTFGRDPIRIRMMGGTVPTRALVDPLGAPFVILPLVNSDNSQHAANENLRIGNYIDGVKSMIGILTQPF
jgi:acetylornithine deacetylase/succinyl-diaminopimelate desuccinylase-like protein